MPNINCDECNAEFAFRDRWAHLTPRPSDPTELVATLWTCPPCGRAMGLTEVTEVDRRFEDDLAGIRREFGERVLFLTA